MTTENAITTSDATPDDAGTDNATVGSSFAPEAVRRHSGAPNDPTPQEIQQRAAEIRSTWSEAERLRRFRADWRPVWTVPETGVQLDDGGLQE